MTSTDIRLKQELVQENKRLSEELEMVKGFVKDWVKLSGDYEAQAHALESTLETERAAHSHLVRQIEAEKDELEQELAVARSQDEV